MLAYEFSLQDGRSCLLREARAADAQAYLDFLPGVFSETDLLRLLPGEFRFTLEEEVGFIEARAADPKAALWLVECEGAMVASAGAEHLPHRRYTHQVEIGMTVAKAYWGLGIGRAMLEKLLEWGREIGLRKINLQVFAENSRARSLYESFGFEREGLLKQDHLRADGTFGDTVLMAKFISGRHPACG